MWDIVNLLGLSSVGAEESWLPRTSLPRHKGYNIGQTRVPDSVQQSGGQCHNNLAGHDGKGPEGGS